MLLGVDVGGTFTDAVLVCDERLFTAKAPTTPRDQSEGVVAAVERVLGEAGREPAEVERFVHGMTVGTNALLEGRGARTALFATEGFTDLEQLGRQARRELYRLCAGHPPPLVPDELRIAVDERCGPDGEIRPLDEAGLREAIDTLDEDAEAAAVCLLWGFRHKDAERRVAALVGELRPQLHVSTSHETAGVFREYERCATTIVDASLSPLLGRYLRRLSARADDEGLTRPEVMLSSGGVAGGDVAAAHGSWTVLSGPAGGAVGAARVADAAGGDAVCLDMGGTSCDVSVARAGEVAMSGSGEVGGRALALPMVDIHTIGAGGGSLAWRDRGGALRVGPRSAGADPGPACYGRGGSDATVTDANLALGYLDSGSPLAGDLTLDVDAAERALSELGRSLGLDVTETAAGIVRVASAEMARAVRVVTVERGIDPRGLALLAFGGAGPLHAAAIADELDITRIVVPRASGVLSALGLVCSERRRDLAESVLLSDGALTRDTIGAVVERLADRGHDELDVSDADVRASYDLRYGGQAFELTVPGEPAPDPDALRRDFDAAHRERYGYADEDARLELVTVRVAVSVGGRPLPGTARRASDEGRRTRSAVFDGERLETAVGGDPAGAEGPAIVDLGEATLVVPPGWRCTRADESAIVVERD